MKINKGNFVPYTLTYLLAATISAVIGQQSCFTPVRSAGLCIPVLECPYVKAQLETFKTIDQFPRAALNYLRKSQCTGDTPGFFICCDASTVTATTTTTAAPVISTDSDAVATVTRTSLSPEDYVSRLNPAGTAILDKMRCGFIEGNKVSHGNATTLAEFPWMTLLRYNTSGNQFHCGGTLITDKYILTAAHCVSGIASELIGIRLGEYDLSTEDDCAIKGRKQVCNPPVEDYGIEKVIPHPQYSRARLQNDVALIKIDGKVSFKSHIRPICLPITAASIELQEEQEYFISGWGTTENRNTSTILLKAKIPHLSLGVCQKIFKVRLSNNIHICAGGQNMVDSCKGDSGGPLFFAATYKLSPRFIQFGVVSFGGAVCGTNHSYPGIYANIVEFMPWITETID